MALISAPALYFVGVRNVGFLLMLVSGIFAIVANGARRIVVHAIGVGQGHNKKLMKKLARESGGKYVAVGMD